MTKRRRGEAVLAVVPQADEAAALSQQQQSPDIPAHVWAILQEAGEEAARALLDILRSPRFKHHPPSQQKALIELALTRAYGLPVRRSLSVSLASDDADAIAASLLGLQDALPETRRASPDSQVDVSGDTPADEA